MGALQSWAIQNGLGLAWTSWTGVGGGRALPQNVATSKALIAAESW